MSLRIRKIVVVFDQGKEMKLKDTVQIKFESSNNTFLSYNSAELISRHFSHASFLPLW